LSNANALSFHPQYVWRGDESYPGRMSILAEVIGAVVQAVLEAAGDLLFHRRSEDHQDEGPGE
ncbi:hypothetical protein, partial [Bacillus mobilis]|uniref:hypothetical protein n=1 Tax=Bacillus mobilis TaxID=2026190 RepID=UPI00362C1C94